MLRIASRVTAGHRHKVSVVHAESAVINVHLCGCSTHGCLCDGYLGPDSDDIPFGVSKALSSLGSGFSCLPSTAAQGLSGNHEEVLRCVESPGTEPTAVTKPSAYHESMVKAGGPKARSREVEVVVRLRARQLLLPLAEGLTLRNTDYNFRTTHSTVRTVQTIDLSDGIIT